MVDDIAFLSAAEAGRRIAAGTLSPVALVQRMLDRIAALNDRLHVYITVVADAALTAAARAEAEIAAGHHRGPLHGVPFAVKDNYFTAGIRTTAGSRLPGRGAARPSRWSSPRHECCPDLRRALRARPPARCRPGRLRRRADPDDPGRGLHAPARRQGERSRPHIPARHPELPMMTEAEIDQDFASALRRGGITLEAERRPVLRESFVRYLEMVRVLDEPLAYADEPAVAMHLHPTPLAGETAQ